MSYAVPDQSSKIGVGVYGEYVDAGEFYGYISNFRFVNGTAVYTSNFTPSTSPLTAITNTKLLCCQDVTIATDNSGTSKTMTAIDSGSTYTQQMAPFNYDWYQDHSGQDNDWTPHNVTLFDISPDSPTNNFCTFNSQDAGPSNSTQGNLKWQSTDHADTCGTFKFPESGKWYYEIMMVDVNSGYAGIAPLRHTKVMGGAWDNDVLALKLSTGQLYYYSSGNWGTHSYGSAFSDWDILQVAIDMDNNKFYFGKNGTWFNSGNPATGSNPAYTLTAAQKALGWKPLVYGPGSPNDLECIANFGQNATFCGSTTAGGNADGEGYGDFKYALPSGFKTLCSKNLPNPAIALPGDHFTTILYTGNGAQNHDISGVGFQPDFTWIKNRDQADSNVLHDAVRGVGKVIYSDLTLAENDNAAYFGPFQSDGFRLQPTTNGHAYNASSEKYVAHNWKANGAGSSNTDGTIDTTATSVNTTAGFAIGAYSGAGNAPKTVGHGLGKLPEVIMVKCRSHTVDWCVYHRHGTDETNSLTLNDTNILDDNDNRWHDTAPTSSVFTVGSSNEVNDSDKTYVYYAFAEIEGFSAFGTYLGTGETNGAFVHTGFRPMWIMLKNISGSVNNWYMFDSKRAPENVVDNALWANENWSDFTSASYNVNFLSNGFKLRTSTQNNASGAQYAYMAFAETPFKTANAR